jgi:hypothetical protein
MLLPTNGKAKCSQAKAYCPISLLSFMQKRMKNLVTKNMKDETLKHVPYIYNNLPTNQAKSTEMAMHHVITYIHETVEKTKLNLSFLRY